MYPISPVLPGQPKWREQEIVFAEGQPQYRSLPALKTASGRVITRWRLTWWDRVRVLVTGQLWLQQLTFDAPLQPQLPSVLEPTVDLSE